MGNLTSALVMGLATLIVGGVIALFSKSKSKKLSENKEKAIRNPQNSLQEIIDIVDQILDAEPDEALKYLNLTNLSLSDNIDGPQEMLKFNYFMYYGMILYDKKSYKESEPYFKKTIDYIESQTKIPDTDHKRIFSSIYILFGKIKYVLGNPDEAEKYRKKAIKLNKSYIECDYS